MKHTLYSAAGCIRCSIVKQYMAENGISFEEWDIKGNGKEAFKTFYKANRKAVRRGLDGIEFPILCADEHIYQGLGVALAFLMAGDQLKENVVPSDLCHGWVGGINLFSSPGPDEQMMSAYLEYLNSSGIRVELETDGRNPGLLEKLTGKGLVGRVLFLLRGPAELYETITGTVLPREDLVKSLELLESVPDYQIIVPVEPYLDDNGNPAFISPEQAAQAAELVEQVTRSKTHPFFIRAAAAGSSAGDNKPDTPNLFKYRTLCRRFMVKCEILN